MKWALSQLKKSRDGIFQLDETVNLTEFLQANHQDVRDASPVHVTGSLDVAANQVAAHIKLTGEWILPCARTLVDVHVPYEITAEETFVKTEEALADESFHLMEKDTVDLTPVVEELLLVEIPMQVFSEEALDDTALPKGEEWALKTEEQLLKEQAEKQPKVDPRLAGLADFFDKNQESE
ncbi:YceD family protein [Listeria costaricensis]|uniref:YceD family protein n=1 Tax=Listeria costaricensis TaxID=2026604 RepID=UPI000C0767FD|nr:DUF177 domain-containing protein [Listeria costaricensis]